MIKFPKTDGLFVRDKEDPKVVTTQHRHPVYSLIKGWWVEEKLDGTNCRIILHPGEPNRCDVRGRSDGAQLSKPLREALERTVHVAAQTEEWATMHRITETGGYPICIYGEGVGLGVNGNPYGMDHCRFVGFDIKFGEHPERGWSAPETVHDFLGKLRIASVPIMGRNITLSQALQLGKGFVSEYAKFVTDYDPAWGAIFAEGVVAKSRIPIYDGRGKLLRLKMKPSNMPTL